MNKPHQCSIKEVEIGEGLIISDINMQISGEGRGVIISKRLKKLTQTRKFESTKQLSNFIFF